MNQSKLKWIVKISALKQVFAAEMRSQQAACAGKAPKPEHWRRKCHRKPELAAPFRQCPGLRPLPSAAPRGAFLEKLRFCRRPFAGDRQQAALHPRPCVRLRVLTLVPRDRMLASCARRRSSQARRVCSHPMRRTYLLFAHHRRSFLAPMVRSPRIHRSESAECSRYARPLAGSLHVRLASAARTACLTARLPQLRCYRAPPASLAGIAWSSAPEKPPYKRFALGAFPEAALPACFLGSFLGRIILAPSSFVK